MNKWTKLSVDLANNGSYLDELTKVYPMANNEKRTINSEIEKKITLYFNNYDELNLIKALLKLEIFPIKDSYIAYLKRDIDAIYRNPKTVNRIGKIIYDMGLNKVMEKATEAKETNRQIGPLFKKWIDNNEMGFPIFSDEQKFINFNGIAIYNNSDNNMSNFCKKYLGYSHNKGIDFIAKSNNKYILGEAKFLTDFGGHQNAQLSDAIATITSNFDKPKMNVEVIKIAILDGVIFIKSKNKNKWVYE
jgi:hypothetical protein